MTLMTVLLVEATKHIKIILKIYISKIKMYKFHNFALCSASYITGTFNVTNQNNSGNKRKREVSII